MTAAEFLAASQKIEEAATPGPWGHYTPRNSPWPNPDPIFGATPGDEVAWTWADVVETDRTVRVWSAHARTVLPRMREALEAVLDLHRPHLDGTPHSWCTNCAESFPCSTSSAIESALAENGETK